ncbi:MAG: HDOD domain-containing protein [Betaproteobacteria bacterium]|nr:HDOD domain-containing protein [Betaproteobacteria bacterium]
MTAEKTMSKLLAAMQGASGLPASESKVASILTALHGEAKSHTELAHEIVEDFTLTQKVLKLANSPMYAPFAESAASVTSALEVVGADGLLHIVLGTKMVSHAELEEDSGLSRTLLASEVARNALPDRLEHASIAALMYDLGSLMVGRYLPDEMAAIEALVVSGRDAQAAAKKVLGLTLQEIGSEVAKHWQLPEQIVSIIDGSGDQGLIEVARFSTAISSLIHEGKAEEASKLVSASSLSGANKSKLSGLVARKVEALRPRMGKKGVAKPRPEQVALERLLAQLSGERKKTVEELAAAMFPAFCELFGVVHCLLFMAVKTGDLYVRHGHGQDVDAFKHKLKISAEFKPTAFHAAIKNNVDVSITDVNKLAPSALPDGFRQLLPNVTRFLVLPIGTDKVTGLVYYDWESNKTLSPGELEVVRKLRNLFLPFFSQ